MLRPSRPNILNIAWIGHGDFGDEAMGYVHRQYAKRLGAEHLTYYHAGPDAIFNGPSDIPRTVIHRSDPGGCLVRWSDALHLRAFDTLLIGGGSLFHSRNSIQWKHDVVRTLKNARPSTFVAGIGISLGPFADVAAERACAAFLNEIDAAAFRDMTSYDIARNISKNLHFFSSLDSSLAFLPSAGYVPSSVPKENDHVGMSFVAKKDAPTDLARSHVYATGIRLINKALDNGMRVTLFTLYSGNDYRDTELHARLHQNCRAPERVDIHTFAGDVLTTVRRMDACSFFVSMRLHSIIFAYQLGIPFLSLAYNPKNGYFCDTIRYSKGFNLTLDTANHPDDMLIAFDALVHGSSSPIASAMPLVDARAIVEKGFDDISFAYGNR